MQGDKPVATLQTTLGDIAKHAKPHCSACAGRGYLTIIKHEPSVGGKLKEFRRDKPCGCALRRYAKAFRKQLSAQAKEVTP